MNRKKPKFKVGQVVMILKSDSDITMASPEPATVMSLNEWSVVVSYGGLGLKIVKEAIRPLTKRERGGTDLK